MTDHTFRAMGCEVRVVHGDAASAERYTRAYAARLTRFDPESELSRLNDDPRVAVPVSPLVRAAVRAALWAARRTGGLVDPTLGAEIVAAGYATSFEGRTPDPLASPAGPRRPARSRGTWRRVRVRGGCVVRPPGVRLDLGGSAKGLLADRLATGAGAVDCGGDIRTTRPLPVDVIHPLTGETVARVDVTGGVASSGIARRCWGTGHHLLDPATGAPAWTGLAGATAFAPTALEAEALAKAALLAGPAGGRAWLAGHGGFLFHEDGSVERV